MDDTPTNLDGVDYFEADKNILDGLVNKRNPNVEDFQALLDKYYVKEGVEIAITDRMREVKILISRGYHVLKDSSGLYTFNP